MRQVTADARVRLDRYIGELVRLGDGLTVDDFRRESMLRAADSARRVRRLLVYGTVSFLVLLVFTLVLQFVYVSTHSPIPVIIAVSIWSFALGGLGAVASLFTRVLKLTPEQAISASDEFEVIGRMILGSIFSMIISTALNEDLSNFFRWLQQAELGENPPAPHQSILMLAPFLLGYSIPLALAVLQKFLAAIELVFGIDDQRPTNLGLGQPRRR